MIATQYVLDHSPSVVRYPRGSGYGEQLLREVVYAEYKGSGGSGGRVSGSGVSAGGVGYAGDDDSDFSSSSSMSSAVSGASTAAENAVVIDSKEEILSAYDNGALNPGKARPLHIGRGRVIKPHQVRA